MISDPNRLVEGMGSFIGGANSAVDPALLSQNQYSWASNVIVRDGYLHTRPGFRFVKTLPTGVIQGCAYYKSENMNSPQIVAMINGKLYDLEAYFSDLPVRDISPVQETYPYISQTASLVQANNFLVCQDGLSRPIVYDGSRTFYSYGLNQDADPAVTLTNCFITSGSATVTISSKAGLTTNMLVIAEGDPSNSILQKDTFISTINSDTQITLSKTAVSTIKTTLKFYDPGIVRISTSIPVGSIVTYGNGRLWVANGRNLYAGDLVGSSLNAEIKFTETIYLSGGGSFYFDSNITGLAFIPGPDTTTGQGDLVVFTRTSINLVRASVYDRTSWQSVAGMQRVIFQGRGAEGFDSIISTDRDLYFRSQDGIRSLLQSVQQGGSNIVLAFADSLEATRIVASDTDRWITYTPNILFDSRMLMGGSPKVQIIPDDSGNPTTRFNLVFTKLISKDFNAGYLTDTPGPVYEGEWSGLQICKMVEGLFNNRRRCFALTCDSDGKNSLYELTINEFEDTLLNNRTLNTTQNQLISSFVETRRFSFDSPFDIKELMRSDLGFSEVVGPLTWTLEYCPDFFPNFFYFQNGTFNVPQSTQTLTTQTPPSLPPGFKVVRTIKPVNTCVPNSKRQANFGYMFQSKISWQGIGKLTLFRLHSSKKDISDLGEC